MKKLFYKILLILISALLYSCFDFPNLEPSDYGDTSVLAFNNHKLYFDDDTGLALCSVSEFYIYKPRISFKSYRSIAINGRNIDNNSVFDFGEITNKSEFELEVKNETNDCRIYTLKFTTLPTVSVEHEGEIRDEPKISAKICLTDPNEENTITEFCGIELRGASANSRPKKSYGIKMYGDYVGTTKKYVSFFNLNARKDWILDAAYADLSCCRNRVSFNIWGEIQHDAIERNHDVLPSAIEGHFVELFINKKYMGIYSLCEKVDGLKIGMETETSEGEGYLYKCENWNDVSRFLTITDTLPGATEWEGWEQKYPDTDDFICWAPLYNFIDFIVNSNDEEFACDYASYIKSSQFIDFSIMVNLIKGYDNVGQNIILASFSKTGSFYFCPWDMDATWGRDWEGNFRGENGMVLFRVYERLNEINPDDFNIRLAERWNQLRENVITHENIYRYFNSYFETLKNSGASERENTMWPESLPDLEYEMTYIDSWIKGRIEYLDNNFNALN